MKIPDRDWLADILIAARLVRQFVAGVSREELEADVMRESAIARQLEIVGEAAKNVSPEFRAAHPEIPWKAMAGMRDILIHAYRTVDRDVVWTAVTVSVPALIASLEPLIGAALEQEEEDQSQ
ncbi:MAG TPA: DUF86 domain-containing protein [Longimicrobiaceae bacterium]|nr:DUF86 domain-containing protein [Longimicrobiaceae bacterium]